MKEGALVGLIGTIGVFLACMVSQLKSHQRITPSFLEGMLGITTVVLFSYFLFLVDDTRSTFLVRAKKFLVASVVATLAASAIIGLKALIDPHGLTRVF